MKETLFIIGIVCLAASPALAQTNTGDPSEVNLKIEAMWVSASGDCTEAVRVFEEVPAVYRDMTSSPVFGAARVFHGTYNCIVFKMSDAITGVSAYDSDWGHCTDGMQLGQDIFTSGSSTCPDGSTVTGTSGEDWPCVYFSTTGTGSNDPYSPGSALPLTGAYEVSADRTATLVTDFRGQIVDTGSQCEIYPPVFSFR